LAHCYSLRAIKVRAKNSRGAGLFA
jgi:hypothetical protein